MSLFCNSNNCGPLVLRFTFTMVCLHPSICLYTKGKLKKRRSRWGMLNESGQELPFWKKKKLYNGQVEENATVRPSPTMEPGDAAHLLN